MSGAVDANGEGKTLDFLSGRELTLGRRLGMELRNTGKQAACVYVSTSVCDSRRKWSSGKWSDGV